VATGERLRRGKCHTGEENRRTLKHHLAIAGTQRRLIKEEPGRGRKGGGGYDGPYTINIKDQQQDQEYLGQRWRQQIGAQGEGQRSRARDRAVLSGSSEKKQWYE